MPFIFQQFSTLLSLKQVSFVNKFVNVRIFREKNIDRPSRWCLELYHKGKRKRKYFKSYQEAKRFDVNEWILQMKECADGYNTTIGDAIKLYVQDYQQRHPNARWKHLQSRLSFLSKWGMADLKIDEISVEILSKKITAQKSWATPSSKFTQKNQFVIFLNWCGLMGYSRKKEWKIKTLRTTTKPREVGILTVEQSIDYINAVAPKYQPATAIMLFAGLRPQGEMEKLKYSHIKYGEWIDVPASKTPNRLITELPNNLWDWLPEKKSGYVMSSWEGMNQNRRRVFKNLGHKYPPDGARHSFGSYGYWAYGLEWTMHSMGHMDYRTFKTYYQNKKVSKKDSLDYFSIVP